MSTIFALIVVILARELVNYFEKKQLLNTIQDLTLQIKAKDLSEYQEVKEGIPTYEPVHVTDQEEYEREIEDNKRI